MSYEILTKCVAYKGAYLECHIRNQKKKKKRKEKTNFVEAEAGRQAQFLPIPYIGPP